MTKPEATPPKESSHFWDPAYGQAVLAAARGRKEPISPEEFLSVELGAGISADNPEFRNLARVTAREMRWMGIRTVLDFGAGTGVYSEAFRQAGFRTFAFEIWEAHRAYIRGKFPRVRLVEQPLTTDLMLFIETAEHMSDREIRDLFARVSPAYVLFSSTSRRTEWDAEWGHINVKEQSEWVRFFDRLGYDLERTFEVPTPWTKFFRRRGAPPLPVSPWARLRRWLKSRR